VKIYQHTQPATTILVVTSVVVLIELICAAAFRQRALLLGAAVIAIAAWIFRSLTIEITDAELTWRFGLHWFVKRVALDQIASAKIVRTSFWEGWGVHYTRFGWLYNASGFDAVAITLRNGKRFCLGTDDAPNLIANLKPS